MDWDPPDQAAEVAFLDREREFKEWRREQRKNAPRILGMLREHLPAEQWQEVECFLSSLYGCECLHSVTEPPSRKTHGGRPRD